MNTLLESNPGLSSRFNRVLHFDDYSPIELARIFAWLCDKNHYKLADGTRPKLMLRPRGTVPASATGTSAMGGRSATCSNKRFAEWRIASPIFASSRPIS